MDIRGTLHQLVDDVLDDDPRRALIAYRRLARDELPWLEKRVVALARREKWSSAKIGRLLGLSRSSVSERFRTIVPSLPSDPQAAHKRWERDVLNGLRRQQVDDEPIAW